MVDRNNVNDKVGSIGMKLSEENQMDREILDSMIEKYRNVYQISIRDRTNVIDWNVHELIMKLVNQSTLLQFELVFNDKASA